MAYHTASAGGEVPRENKTIHQHIEAPLIMD